MDVENLDTDGDALIDVDALLKRFRLAGPREQFFFVDACRDLAVWGAPVVRQSHTQPRTIEDAHGHPRTEVAVRRPHAALLKGWLAP